MSHDTRPTLADQCTYAVELQGRLTISELIDLFGKLKPDSKVVLEMTIGLDDSDVAKPSCTC